MQSRRIPTPWECDQIVSVPCAHSATAAEGPIEPCICIARVKVAASVTVASSCATFCSIGPGPGRPSVKSQLRAS
jgi:hypothetical protein